MGFEIGQVFRPLDDADGTGLCFDMPDVTIHPNTATSKVPDAGWHRLYPYNDDHGWYAMNHDGDYGPLLIGEIPPTDYLTVSATDVWFAGHAKMEDDAGGRQYGFQWFASAVVTDNHSGAYVGHVFAMGVPIASGKSESDTYYCAFFDSQRDTDLDQGHLFAMNGVYQEYGHGGGGAFTPETDYAVGYKAAIYNSKGTIHSAIGFEALPAAGGSAGTTELYTAFYGHGGFGDVSIGTRMSNDLKEIWEFQDLPPLSMSVTDLSIGSGRNYSLDADGDYNIDGFDGDLALDGVECHFINITASRTFTIIDNYSGGSAGSGKKVYTAGGGNISLGPREILHLLFRLALDSGAGAWIAWKN